MRTAQPALAGRVAQRPDLGEGGFTLVEFMISALIMTIVLGSTVALATQIQTAYGTQLDDAAVEQEARFALDWIARDLRSAASDPYEAIADNQEVQIDPNAGAVLDDSIRVRADIHPPNGLPNADADEDITIALDLVNTVPCGQNSLNMTCTSITREDHAAVGGAVAMTEAIFTELSFMYLDAAHMPTLSSELVAYVQVQVTAVSRGRNLFTGAYTTSTLATEVRLRAR